LVPWYLTGLSPRHGKADVSSYDASPRGAVLYTYGAKRLGAVHWVHSYNCFPWGSICKNLTKKDQNAKILPSLHCFTTWSYNKCRTLHNKDFTPLPTKCKLWKMIRRVPYICTCQYVVGRLNVFTWLVFALLHWSSFLSHNWKGKRTNFLRAPYLCPNGEKISCWSNDSCAGDEKPYVMTPVLTWQNPGVHCWQKLTIQQYQLSKRI
jgi:hypothetical protein